MAAISSDDILKHGTVEKALAHSRVEARQHLEETGSLPEWWDLGVSLGSSKGPPRKYATAEQYLSKGMEYLERCALRDVHPTKAGMILWLGFTNNSQWHDYPRRNPEFREAHGILLQYLQHVMELGLQTPAGQAGKMFILKNLPDGLSPEDPADKKLEYSWRDKQTTELTGEDGGPIRISRDEDPEKAYLRMLRGGVLEDEEEEASCE